jgi:hypothetical protein
MGENSYAGKNLCPFTPMFSAKLSGVLVCENGRRIFLVMAK